MCPVSIHAHVIRRWISMCKQKHVFVFQLCLMHWRRGRRRLTFVESTSQPLAHQARPSFHTMCTIVHTSVFARHAAALSTGSTCSEENTSDIGKNCLFFPPASLLIRGPLAFTCHTREDRQAGARRDVLVRLHCTQVGLPAADPLFLHSCLTRAV